MKTQTDTAARSVPLHRFVLACLLAPFVAAYCFAAYCVGLLPLVIALIHWDDAQYCSRNDDNEAKITQSIITFMLWPWRRWKRLFDGENDLAHGAAGAESNPKHIDSMAKKSTSKTRSAPAIDRAAHGSSFPLCRQSFCRKCGGHQEIMVFSWESKTGYKICPDCRGTGYETNTDYPEQLST